MSALTFGNLLHEIFNIDVPVGVIVSPASDLRTIAGYIEIERTSSAKRPTFAAVHGRDAIEVYARDLTWTSSSTPIRGCRPDPGPAKRRSPYRPADRSDRIPRPLPGFGPAGADRPFDCKLICLVRAKDDESARQRLDETSTVAIPNYCGTIANWPPII